MRVYELRTQKDRYCNFALRDEHLNSIFNEFDGRSLAEDWVPLPIKAADEDDEVAELADYALLGTIPVFSERAVDALSGVLRQNGELLPLLYERRPYFAYNVTTVIDALDQQRSSVKSFADGQIMWIDRYAFTVAPLATATIFKIPELPRAYVFVTDKFVDLARPAGLQGIEFKHIWTDIS